MERMYQEDLPAGRQVWEVDPLLCPNCGGEMKIVSFITEASAIWQILEHLNLWEQTLSRDPPDMKVLLQHGEIVYESFDDGWECYDERSTLSYIA